MPEAVEVLIEGAWTQALVLSRSVHADSLWTHVRTLDDVFGCFPGIEVRNPA